MKTLNILLAASGIFLLSEFAPGEPQGSVSSYEISVTDSTGGYQMENNQVVFTFIPSQYSWTTKSRGPGKSLSSIRIKDVYVSCETNNWIPSDKNWKMKAMTNGYEFRIPIQAFGSKRKVEFKFVVNGKYWVEPAKGYSNITPSGSWDGPMNFVLSLPEN